MIFRRRYLGNFKESEGPSSSSTRNACLGGPQKIADDFWAANKDVILAAMGSPSGVSPTQWMNALASDAVFAQTLSDEPLKALYSTHIKSLLQSECDRFCAAAQGCSDGAPLVELFIESWGAYHRKAATLSHLLSKCDARLEGIRASSSHSYMTIQPTACRLWSAAAERAGVSTRVAHAICDMIRAEREGSVAPSAAQNELIKRCLDAFVAIGVDDADPAHAVSKGVYVAWFEKMFLDETAKFFAREALDYAPKGLKCLTELMYARVTGEEARLALYLQRDPTERRLYKVLNTVFVMEYKEHLTTYFGEALKISDEEALGHVYALLDRVPGYVEPLFPLVQAQIEHDGLAATRFAPGSEASSSPELYVRAVVGVHDKYRRIIGAKLGGNKSIYAVLSIACTKFANENEFLSTLAAEASAGSSGNTAKSIAAQCVASFADTVLKKTPGCAAGVDEAGRDAAVTSFGLLEDKDVFMLFHAKKLANRLLNGLSASIEDEKVFLARIKDSSSFNETSVKKMEDMIHDIEQSADLQPLFARYCEEEGRGEKPLLPAGALSMRVLNKLNWSIPVSPVDEGIRVPCDALRNSLAAYEAFYLSRNKNTRFAHVHSQSRAELEFRNGAHNYRMMTSGYQAAILLLFSSPSSPVSLTLGEIAAQLCVANVPSLMLSILGITKTKILLTTATTPSLWDANTVFKFNVKFMSKKPKFSLPQEKSLSLAKASLVTRKRPASPPAAAPASPSHAEGSNSPASPAGGAEDDVGGMGVVLGGGTPEMKEEVENGRVLCIEAAIVRVMKGRKVMDFNGLHDEVAGLLRNWFVMPLKLFKRAIEGLIEDEYLKRSATPSGEIRFEYVS